MTIRTQRWLWPAILFLLVGAAGPPETPTANEKKPAGASPDINSRFLDPELDVDQWIERFEVESREVYAARNEVLRATGIQAGSRVADIGAGTGLYTRLFAGAAGLDGWVYAVEISPRFLEHINQWANEVDADNVTAILGRTDDISLPVDSVDLVFVCDTYHHFEAVVPMLASIRRALAPDGVLVLIDFEKIPGESSPFIMGHVRAGKEVFRAEIEAEGFAFVEEVEIAGFEENYFLKFKSLEVEWRTAETVQDCHAEHDGAPRVSVDSGGDLVGPFTVPHHGCNHQRGPVIRVRPGPVLLGHLPGHRGITCQSFPHDLPVV